MSNEKETIKQQDLEQEKAQTEAQEAVEETAATTEGTEPGPVPRVDVQRDDRSRTIAAPRGFRRYDRPSRGAR